MRYAESKTTDVFLDGHNVVWCGALKHLVWTLRCVTDGTENQLAEALFISSEINFWLLACVNVKCKIYNVFPYFRNNVYSNGYFN